jgi:hypothetical protein
MVNQMEVRESHEQLSEAWSLYARCSGAGEVVDLDGLRIANARQPWFLMNAALLTEPVSSQTNLAAHAHTAIEYFGHGHRPWFLAGSQHWLGDGAPETLSRFGVRSEVERRGSPDAAGGFTTSSHGWRRTYKARGVAPTLAV